MDSKLESRDLKSRAVRYGLLEDWYGEEFARTEIADHTSAGESLSDALSRVIDDFGDDEIAVYIRLTENWSSYCGEALEKYLTPAGIREGILTVTVPHIGLMSMITPSIELIHAKIRKDFGDDFCKEIRVIAGSGSRRRRNR